MDVRDARRGDGWRASAAAQQRSVTARAAAPVATAHRPNRGHNMVSACIGCRSELGRLVEMVCLVLAKD